MIVSMQNAADYARRALQIAWDGNLPVDPTAIAQSLVIYKTDDATGVTTSIPIRVRPLSSNELHTASGQASLERTPDGNYVFYCDFNHEEISYRNRFTIAHELGHVLLGHVNEGNPRERDTSFGNYNPIERAANTFAAELIMPEQKVRELFSGAQSVQQLSEIFGVSNAAMSYRLQNLGLF
ncbi:ImmA/IrrE family metallo-endopeptidase [Pseudomonas aeruginosa]|uniref:ImmA/IrrE family metallo-endopeptidase n=1 Tax=Pseudomonas aeruginosa TaxID=287 RepID=A0A643EEM3_PSEAI|nr:ImmA/IrrE family metallo-endopeptidase [Pseudomonas aeruginosa]EIU2540582.1 ImmA/IrrE family metallo-endopeptidase [Pseudomonas aeruginosa]EIU2893947.1 ImmA/IrrE family metallo-endopeptidase [Pseudomonas aeruginosa]EIU2918889.1 ImmA/IrrE family metallo-endopeptidase [Pseudomonas aeruginosa]EJN6723817.1 ImmA/IrrE family metallo-endopeptidase [Pseudomonas aeruginosa]EKU7560662.1 ImmA/IrrE family metallo-endopeptidase [Pseudomonas aeruginosa]